MRAPPPTTPGTNVGDRGDRETDRDDAAANNADDDYQLGGYAGI